MFTEEELLNINNLKLPFKLRTTKAQKILLEVGYNNVERLSPVLHDWVPGTNLCLNDNSIYRIKTSFIEGYKKDKGETPMEENGLINSGWVTVTPSAQQKVKNCGENCRCSNNDAEPIGHALTKLKLSKMLTGQKKARVTTVSFWNDGTKTVVRTAEGDNYDIETGLMLCFFIKLSGMSHTQAGKVINWVKPELLDDYLRSYIKDSLGLKRGAERYICGLIRDHTEYKDYKLQQIQDRKTKPKTK